MDALATGGYAGLSSWSCVSAVTSGAVPRPLRIAAAVHVIDARGAAVPAARLAVLLLPGQPVRRHPPHPPSLLRLSSRLCSVEQALYRHVRAAVGLSARLLGYPGLVRSSVWVRLAPASNG